MENELQYLFLEIECSTRVCAGGREGQADRGAARAANLQMTAAVQVHDTGLLLILLITKSTQRCVAEGQKVVILGAKSPELEGISGPSGLTCCLQKRKPRSRDVRHQLTN